MEFFKATCKSNFLYVGTLNVGVEYDVCGYEIDDRKFIVSTTKYGAMILVEKNRFYTIQETRREKLDKLL
jgi:hypothetical protein